MSKVSDLQKLQAEMASFQRTTFNMLNELKNGSQQEMPAIEEKRKPLSAFLTIFDESEREGCNETAFEIDMETADPQSSTVKKSTARGTRTSLSKAIEEPSIFTILRGKPEQVLGILDGMELCRRDLVCLRPNENVNEIVVGAWLTMVHKARNPTDYFFDSCLLEPTWLQQMWTFNKRLLDVGSLKDTGERALQSDKIIVPCSINGSHWSLIVCVPSRKSVRVFDPLRDDKQFDYADFVVKILDVMHAVQDDDFKAAVPKTKWFVERNHNRSPRLSNPKDSGIFVCWLAEKILGNESPGLINSDVIKAKRAHILSCIVSGSVET
ncbi:hypothetical protein AC1031_021612 [Aphanomyces cochlioides]|nr:hypothetical protein AC1031_021612 [Aphanomyces cochlioides]